MLRAMKWNEKCHILMGTVWDFVLAKCSLRCWIEKCGGLPTRAVAPTTLEEKQVKKKEVYI